MGLKGFNEVPLDTGKLAGVTLFCVGTPAPRLAAGVLPDPEGAAGQRGLVGHGADHRRLLHRRRVLVVGRFLDAIPAIIVGTILQPMAQSAGMDPGALAIAGIVSLAFGLVTPPYGLCLMTACSVAKIRIVDALKDTMIMLVPMLLVLAAIIVWPSIPLFLPRLFPPGTL
jgi:hypothetical protein